mmetsp:Transcript_38610/g.54346  ORF Transcript_38610/g.54346 Transcript_38610/m.54346 type:complete len:268 (-) Transcript_38610:619-1422(-)|eukprot:CAMPEP_0202470298 /NCGR_PEP_ID=MMETSP1360-20130828/81225_1 /ASSEMBLY_ACC=CAM_ASM_000848 /TAXON_ID=515479 /ORGANISM="Licmophora paradoxa, Strain CCMP2313" /LENGTH=267 /DNA_ID=CAMNT_0049095959 /DNA_START=144 /DNA_END=947 /DNA_ORIENTATION=-
MEDPRYDPIALVRSANSAKKLVKSMDCGLERIIVCDICNENIMDTLEGMEGTEAMVICTSAVPQISKRSLITSLLKVPWNVIRRGKAIDFRSLHFKFKNNQYPEIVDYQGQMAQIDLAKKLGVARVVVVSSMGGTDPDNFLNRVGKNPDGSGDGDILLWKRKAEKYLIDSGLSYSIIHPGGLIDTDPGIEQIVLDVDDKLMENKKRSISRADVASICVAAITLGKGDDDSVSFDCITRPVEEGTPVIPSELVLQEFLETGVTADYSL